MSAHRSRGFTRFSGLQKLLKVLDKILLWFQRFLKVAQYIMKEVQWLLIVVYWLVRWDLVLGFIELSNH